MSVEAVSWVLANTQAMAPTRRLVLVAAADHAGQGGWVWASLTTLATRAGCSEDTARRALQDAVRRRWLVEAKDGPDLPEAWRHIRADRRPNLYRLTLPRGGTVLPREVVDGVAPETPRGGTRPGHGVAPVLPEPNREPEGEPLAAGSPAAGWADDVQLPIEYVPTGTPWKVRVDGKTKDLLAEALARACRVNLDERWPKQARQAFNGALESLRAVGVSPVDVRARAAIYRRRYPDTVLTAKALETQWPTLISEAEQAAAAREGGAEHQHLWTWWGPDDDEYCTGCKRWRKEVG